MGRGRFVSGEPSLSEREDDARERRQPPATAARRNDDVNPQSRSGEAQSAVMIGDAASRRAAAARVGAGWRGGSSDPGEPSDSLEDALSGGGMTTRATAAGLADDGGADSEETDAGPTAGRGHFEAAGVPPLSEGEDDARAPG